MRPAAMSAVFFCGGHRGDGKAEMSGTCVAKQVRAMQLRQASWAVD